MKEKEKKICIVVKAFLEHPNFTNEELAQLVGLSSSSVQRYLSDPAIKEIFNEETFNKIKELISNNIKDARRKGGINSFKNNEPIKNELGIFVGNKKTDKNNRLKKKCNDILIFANIFLKNENLSLEQIADFYNTYYSNGVDKVTRDYVYDCLSNKSSYSLLADNLYEVITVKLKERRILGNKNGALATNSRRQKKWKRVDYSILFWYTCNS